MKKLFFAALIALAGFTACGTKNVETAATEATEQREVGGGDIAYVQVCGDAARFRNDHFQPLRRH